MTPVPLTTPSQSPAQRRATIEAAELPESIPALLDAAAADTPDATLWEFFDDGLSATYDQVRRDSLLYGALLTSLGIKRGDAVAVMLPNIPEMPLTWLGLGRIGGIMVPVNTRFTARELAYVLNDSGARLLLIHADLVGILNDSDFGGIFNAEVIVVGDKDWAARLKQLTSDDCLTPKGQQQDLMNIQYTSGTTGLPKGCLLTHEYWLITGVVNAWRDGRRFRRILATTPFSYMDPQWLLLMAIYQRGTLVVGRKQSASKFAGWLSQHRIEFCLFPEAASKQPPAPHDADNPVVRANVYGVRASVHAVIEKRYGLIAREAFGMTEIGSGLYMPMESSDMTGSGSCGIASPFRQTRVINDQGDDVADGEIGELLIRGRGIFLGYHANPTASAQALRDGWFHTGDLFRRDARGFHHIVGRKKDMIRRSGENIACREVEGVLRDMEEIEEVAVIAVPDDLRGEEVKAYVTVQNGQRADAELVERVVAFATRRLAVFKIPRYFEFIDIMPRTASFKVAKADLIKSRTDHRIGTFDRVENIWR